MRVLSILIYFLVFLFLPLHANEGVKYRYIEFEKNANIKGAQIFAEAYQDSSVFWAKCAEEIAWFKKWETVLAWNSPYCKWFEEGELNACYNCIDRHLPNKKDQVALFWENERGETKKLTYEELHKAVCKYANGLKKLGVKKGECVAIYMPMTPEAIVSMLACARIGAVHSVIFGGIGAQAVKEKLEDMQPKVLVTADGGYRRGKIVPYKSSIEEILPQTPFLEHVVVLKHTNTPTPFVQGRDLWLDQMIEGVSDECSCESMKAEDLLFVLYTSGTTGKAKGIMHTTGGYMVGVHNTFKWVFDLKPSDIYFCTADVGWITGHSYVVYGPLSNGVTQLIYEGTFDTPDKEQCWKLIEKYKATIFYTAPTLIRTFMKWGTQNLKSHDISSLRLLGSIGEPLNPEAWRWFEQEIGKSKCPIMDTWFQTETGAFVIAPIPGVTALKPGSISQPLPGYEVTILNEEGEKTDKGMLAITKPFPSMMRGIYKDPNRYVKTYWSTWDGRFYYAGDSASKDPDGYIWVHGRNDEVIKVAGHRIGTAEVENALIQNQAVAESAVVGVSDALKGQIIVAYVILKKDQSTTEEELKKFVEKYLGSYARPEKIVIVSELPKTRSGKILRRLIKNLIEGEPIGDTSSLENKGALDELTQVGLFVREELKKKHLESRN